MCSLVTLRVNLPMWTLAVFGVGLRCFFLRGDTDLCLLLAPRPTAEERLCEDRLEEELDERELLTLLLLDVLLLLPDELLPLVDEDDDRDRLRDVLLLPLELPELPLLLVLLEETLRRFLSLPRSVGPITVVPPLLGFFFSRTGVPLAIIIKKTNA